MGNTDKPLDQKRTGQFLPCTGLAQRAGHKSREKKRKKSQTKIKR